MPGGKLNEPIIAKPFPDPRLADVIKALTYWSPIINKNVGVVGPPAAMLRDGLSAYADGTNWNPLGDGTQGEVIYYAGTWHGMGGGGASGDSSTQPSLPAAPAVGKWRFTLLNNGELYVQTHTQNILIYTL